MKCLALTLADHVRSPRVWKLGRAVLLVTDACVFQPIAIPVSTQGNV